MGDRETVDLGLESEARVDLVPFRWPTIQETVCVMRLHLALCSRTNRRIGTAMTV